MVEIESEQFPSDKHAFKSCNAFQEHEEVYYDNQRANRVMILMVSVASYDRRRLPSIRNLVFKVWVREVWKEFAELPIRSPKSALKWFRNRTRHVQNTGKQEKHPIVFLRALSGFCSSGFTGGVGLRRAVPAATVFGQLIGETPSYGVGPYLFLHIFRHTK